MRRSSVIAKMEVARLRDHFGRTAGVNSRGRVVEGIPGTTKGIDTSAYRSQDATLVMPDTPGFGLRLLVRDFG